jgi:hypothetical protein
MYTLGSDHGVTFSYHMGSECKHGNDETSIKACVNQNYREQLEEHKYDVKCLACSQAEAAANALLGMKK